MLGKKIMIIDGNSILNRAFYGLQGEQLLKTSDMIYTNAIYGFLNIYNKYMDEEKPEYVCVAFDLKAPTFRHKEFAGYKAKRKGMPPELAMQMPYMKQILNAMNVKIVEIEGYEADDILGTIAGAAENAGMKVVIITGDKDSLQLVTDNTTVKIPSTKAGKTITKEFNIISFENEYGIKPCQFVDVKALMGDQSDNIPGVEGIGEKTAFMLIKEYGSIENIYDKIESIQKESLKNKLINGKESAFMSKMLSKIDTDVPVEINWEEYSVKPYDNSKLLKIFRKLEFKSLIEKMGINDTLQEQYDAMSQYENKAMNKNDKLFAKNASSIEDINNIIELICSKKEVAFYALIEKNNMFEYSLSALALAVPEQDGKLETLYVDLISRFKQDEILQQLKLIFEDQNIKKYGHDVKQFEVYLKNKGINLYGAAFDTMIAAYIINPSRNNYDLSEIYFEYMQDEGMSLESLESIIGKGKNCKKLNEISSDVLAAFACKRAAAVFELKNVLHKVLEENMQLDLYYEIELPLSSVLAEMEYWGFKVNPKGLIEYSGELEAKISELESKIYELAGEKFNINSTKQLSNVLFEKLSLPPVKKTKTGYSTDAEVLEQLADKHEIVANILEYRQLVKLKSTYVEGLLSVINPKTGRIHSSFNQTVTATGRISSTEPNLQNIPIKLDMGRKIRKVFIAENEDFVLLDADYSQIELRILAHISSDENLIYAFNNDFDIHTSTASKIFGVPPEKVTPLMRSGAKAVNFGIVYGIGDFSLAKDLGITRKEARKYIDDYLAQYPKVKQYMRDIVEQGKKFGYVTTLFGRRRYLPELKSSNFTIRGFGERIAMNTPIQGSAADIIKVAMVKVYNELKKGGYKSRLILQVHDELIIEAYKEEQEAVSELLKRNMENAVKLAVPLKVEVKSGNSWYDTK